MTLDWSVSAAALVVGAVVGMTGMGGGSLMTGLMILVWGIHPVTAVGTDLLFAAATKVGGAGAHWRNGNVDWRLVARLAAGSVPAALLSLWLLAGLPRHSPGLVHGVALAVGLGLVVAGLTLLARPRIERWLAARQASVTAPPIQQTARKDAVARTVLLGAVLGVLVPLTSVGAGALGLAVLVFLYPMLLPVRLVGSDIAHAVPLTLVAGLGHAMIGTIDWALLATLLIGSVPGVVIGSNLAHRAPARLLNVALGLVLAGIGVALIAAHMQGR